MNENERKIDYLSDKEILASLYGSQAVMLIIGVAGAYFVFDGLPMFLQILSFTWYETIVIGGSFALIVVGVDLLMYRFIPYKYLDDGGINERVFKGRSVGHLIVLCLVIAVVEELLFRAVLQTAFGLIAASLIFALVHVRYLTKPILFSFVLMVSFSLGLLFEYTNNLSVTIFAHFLIDFLLGLFLRKKSRK